MRQMVDEPVSVYFLSQAKEPAMPLYIQWRNKNYKVDRLDHTFRMVKDARDCIVYCCIAAGQYFELLLDLTNMKFTLRQIDDGNAT